MTTWVEAQYTREIKENNTHIWRVNISEQLKNLIYFRSLLNDDEISTANHHHFIKNVYCSIVSRACLRLLLSDYLKCTPFSITFEKNEYGKLFIPAKPNFFFNVAHTDELILYAFAMKPIGIDIEDTRRNIEFHDISELFFAGGEIKKLKSLQGDDLRSAFFRVWTQKEAFVKATGEGLSFPLKQFEVTVLTEEPACILSVNRETQHDWSLQSFIPEIGFQAAFVKKHKIENVSYFSYPGQLDQLGILI